MFYNYNYNHNIIFDNYDYDDIEWLMCYPSVMTSGHDSLIV